MLAKSLEFWQSPYSRVISRSPPRLLRAECLVHIFISSSNGLRQVPSSRRRFPFSRFFCGPSLYSGSFVAFSEFWFSWFSTDSKNSDRTLI